MIKVTPIFLISLLCGGIVLIIAVVVLCVWLRRIRKIIHQLPAPLYTTPGLELEVKKRKKKARNYYHFGKSPRLAKKPSSMCRSYSDESITFVPDTKILGPQDGSQVAPKLGKGDSMETTPQAVSLDATTCSTAQPALSSAQGSKPAALGREEVQINMGKVNDAFVPEGENSKEREQQAEKPTNAQNLKRPKLSTFQEPAATCQPKLREQTDQRYNTQVKSTGKSEHCDPAVSTDNGANANPISEYHSQSASLEDEQQLYLNQEEAIDMIDQTLQAYDDSKNDKATQNTDIETNEPIYINFGEHASTYNPETHLISDENTAEEYHISTTSQAAECSHESITQHQDEAGYVECIHEPTGAQDYDGHYVEQSAYLGCNNENPNQLAQNEYQDYNAQGGYQDYHGHDGYQDYSGQGGYQDYHGQNEYQDYSGQGGYQDYHGQNEYQDYSGQGGYQGYHGQSEYQQYDEQIGYEYPVQSGYYDDSYQHNNETELQPFGDEDEAQNRYQALHNLSNQQLNEGFQDEDVGEQIYENTAEGEKEEYDC